MKQWKKSALIAAPLLVLGSVYAFASSGSNVSFTVHPAQSTASTQSAGTNTGVTASNAASSNASQSTTTNTNVNNTTTTPANVQNPFLVPGLTDNDTSSTTGTSTTEAPSTATQTTGSTTQISVDSIRHLNLHSMTPQGLIQFNYIVAGNGTAMLEGKEGGKDLHIRGSQAKQYVQGILNQLQLLPVLQKVSNDGSAQLTLPEGVQIQALQVELNNKQTFHLHTNPTSVKNASQKDKGEDDQGEGHGKDKEAKHHGKGHDK
jgi:hypothetical protein